jgi:hypothetical protein
MQKKANIKNIYHCGTGGDHPPQTLAATLTEARKSLGCTRCEATGCHGPVLWEEPKKQKNETAVAPVFAPNTDIQAFVKGFNEMSVPKAPVPKLRGSNLDIDEETDAAIRRDLGEMASVAARRGTIAPQLVAIYGNEMRAVREKGHGWRKIAKIYRKYGLRIGENSLKIRIER